MCELSFLFPLPDSGNDHLNGGEGNDYLYGGAGDDILVYNNAGDKLDGGADFDVALALVDSFESVDDLFSNEDIKDVEMIIGATSDETMAKLESLTNMDALKAELGVVDLKEEYFKNSENWKLDETQSSETVNVYTSTSTDADMQLTVAVKQMEE